MTQPKERSFRPLISPYMPWFESQRNQAVVGGWHWAWGASTRIRVEASGREHRHHIIIADWTVIRRPRRAGNIIPCFMKIAGIDGVIADWYGRGEFNDYAVIMTTRFRCSTVKKRAIKFALIRGKCIKAMSEKEKFTSDQAIGNCQDHLQFCEKTPGSMSPGMSV